ncbi:hypothetical protein PF006_g27848 [Phytophthora fragariae]|uniref:Auto-transporter adhesin head GIN domain-containing protein n=1 Tax=Phytophthora fragariae TaxID=53985 RepID=A0A6A3DRK5_9STRA|nr:hypothetical protein PF009_g28653 [Phytophthora fragariae]KAE9077798.1 hypothetical protein PF006_g27848 [Phytophthora fragariae]
MKVSSFHTLLLAAASLSAQATADFKVTPGSTIKAATSKNVNFVKQWTLTASATTNTIDSIDLSLAGNAYVSYVSGLPSGVIGYVNVSGDKRLPAHRDFLASPDAVKDVNSKRSAHVVIEDGVLVTQGKRAELQIDASGSSAVYVSAPDTAVSVRQLSLETTGSAKIEYSVESIHARSELQMDAQGSSSISVLSSTVKTSQLELDALNSGKICIDAQEVKAAWRDIQGKNKISMPNAVKKHGTTGTFACVASKLPARKAAQITASPTSATGYVDNDDLDDDLDNDLNDSTED